MENFDKNKKFLTKTMGVDFTDKIKQITSSYDVPMNFDDGVGSNLINMWLNYWGPMYLVNINGKDYLYQDRGDFEMFIDEEGFDYVDDEIQEEIGISVLGLKFSDVVDIFFEEKDDNIIVDHIHRRIDEVHQDSRSHTDKRADQVIQMLDKSKS